MTKVSLKRYRVSKNFYLDELVDATTYHKYNAKAKLYRLVRKVDNEMLSALQYLRAEMDEPATINTWWKAYLEFEGDLDSTLDAIEIRNLKQWRGLRVPGNKWYSEDSMHAMFKAVDVVFNSRGWLNKARKIIWNNWKDLGVTGMEVEVSWLHIDTRFMINQTKLFVFNRTSVLSKWAPK